MALVLWKPSLLTEMHKEKSVADLIVGLPVQLCHDGQGTGALLWSAGVALARCLVNSKAAERIAGCSIQGKFCIEVGGGLGIVSIAARRAGAAKVVCTDGEDKVVAIAQRNLDFDYSQTCGCGEAVAPTAGSSYSNGATEGAGSSGATGALLSWGDVPEATVLLNIHGRPGTYIVCSASLRTLQRGIRDIVFVADCVFGEDDKVWAALRTTLAVLCSDPTTTLVIAQTERYPAREAKFFQKLLKMFRGSSLPACKVVPGYTQGSGPPITLWTLKIRD